MIPPARPKRHGLFRLPARRRRAGTAGTSGHGGAALHRDGAAGEELRLDRLRSEEKTSVLLLAPGGQLQKVTDVDLSLFPALFGRRKDAAFCAHRLTPQTNAVFAERKGGTAERYRGSGVSPQTDTGTVASTACGHVAQVMKNTIARGRALQAFCRRQNHGAGRIHFARAC